MTTGRNTRAGEEDLLLAPPERQAELEDMFQMLTAIGIAAHRPGRPPLKQGSRATPLTIFSGFLGAGKTTVLNELLDGDHGLQLAVIVNDFGSVNIDASLIRAEDAGIISLENGCVCCSSSGQLGDTLDVLTRRDPPPDAIVLESSGIADPLNTAHVALVNRNIKLDGVITVVDTETLLQRLDDPCFGHLVRRQLEAADLAILNKVDLVSPERLSAVRERVRACVPAARLTESRYGRVPTEVLLGLGTSRLAEQRGVEPAGDHSHAALDSWTFSTEGPVDRSALTGIISDLPDSIVRAKGILHTADDPDYRVIFQLVGKRWQFERGEPWGEQTPGSNLVLVGACGSVEREELERRFKKVTGTLA